MVLWRRIRDWAAALPIGLTGCAALLGVFLIDIRLAVGFTVPLLYVPVVLMGLVGATGRLTLCLASGATLLTVADLLVHAQTGPLSFTVLFNRALAVVAIWITALGVTLYRRTMRRHHDSMRALQDVKYALDQAAIVATTDVTGRITHVNDKFCEISGYSRAELLGQDHRIVNSGYHDKEFIRGLWRTIAKGRIWRAQICNRAKDGSLYWVDTTIVPFLDHRGKPWQYMAIRSDITAQKAQEERLRDQEALAAVGEFAAVVAHEVRNPLGALRNGVQLIAEELTPGSDNVQLARDIIERVDVLNTVIEDLLSFARPHPMQPSAVPIQLLVSDIIGSFKQDPAMTNITIACTFESDVQVQADPNQLRQMFLNLLLNAAQAMEGQGRIHVHVARRPNGCVVAIGDQGPGVPLELRERIFDPFFTTKRSGTGLGLPTVKRIVDAHGGQVEIECPAGGGTIMRVFLPFGPPVAQPADEDDVVGAAAV
jgi:PAS domain S-box-containing protein